MEEVWQPFICIFSVSQRQIVTHLPQFAMLAIAFVLIAFYKKKLVTTKDEQQTTNLIKKLYQDWQRGCERLSRSLEKFPFVKNQLPCFLIIIIGIILYYPWAKGQGDFIKIVKKGRNYLNTLQLEKITDSGSQSFKNSSLEKLVGKKTKQELIKSVKEIKKIALESQLQIQEGKAKNTPKKTKK